MKPIVRFAPSPTGELHLGGVRTALFNWLFGRQRGGTVRLRLEDTDRARSSEEHAQSILDALEWLGLDWDGPVVRQSERAELYRAHLQELEEAGKAYRCTCSLDELETMRERARAAGRPFRYPGTCRDRTTPVPRGSPSVLRLRVPDIGPPEVDDLLSGHIGGGVASVDDFVLTRSDGSALYNFCCVVDDIELGVTHVIRGADHVENTVRQAAIYDALGRSRPLFAHVPLVKGMSKRLGSESVLSYRQRGFLPEAILNYVARLGWSHGDQEVFSVEELLEHFELEQVGRSVSTVNADKLRWLNEQHLKECSGERLAELVAGSVAARAGAPDLARAASLMRTRVGTLTELADALRPYYVEDDAVPIDGGHRAALLDAEGKELLARLADLLEGLERFEAADLRRALSRLVEERGTTLGAVARPSRLALTGSSAGPKLVDIMVLLGKRSTVARLRASAA